jgi:hypothetical protein
MLNTFQAMNNEYVQAALPQSDSPRGSELVQRGYVRSLESPELSISEQVKLRLQVVHIAIPALSEVNDEDKKFSKFFGRTRTRNS